jgi:acyl-[acyl-carrier-protein]-phospholipid O-acyltransferase/long-chain-fatty-acid--[acyl-carrier-protein] ligase
MKQLFKIGGFTPYIFIVFLNAMTDLGHKIILQNTIFKAYDGSELIILTAIVNALILLPFIFLFSPAGFLSDKYPKVQIIRVASLLAVGITTLILFSYIMGWFWFAFAMTFILAAQSAIYAPAKYGLIKEMVGNEKLTQANAMVQSVTIISILAGAVVYSIFFESLLDNQVDKAGILQAIYPLGFALIGASIVEFLLSLHLIRKVEIKKGMKFKPKRYANLTYLRGNIRVIKRNQTVWLSIIGLSIFWGISQLVVAIFGEYLKENMGVTNTVIAQGLLSISGLGIVAGSLFVGRVSRKYIETGIIPIGALGITISLFFISSLNSLVALGILFFFYGFFSGLFIVPLNTLIQFATPTRMMGKVLAGSNFMQNVSMFIFLILSALFAYLGFSSKGLFTLAMFIALVGFVYTLIKLPQSMVRFVVRFFFGLRYKISVEGLDNIKSSRGMLLLGNHISFLDWAFLQIAYPKQIRFVIDRTYYNVWYLKPIFRFFGAIPISPRGGKKALSFVSQALNNGDTVAIFPEGHLSRNGHLGQFQKGFELATAEVRGAIIVPFYLRGLWEGRFSHASGKMKNKKSTDIGVSFGKSMPIHSTVVEVKDAVFKLSIHSWESYTKRLPTLPKAWIKEAKQVKRGLVIADSTGVELNGYRFITAVLLMRKAFKKLLGEEQNIGLIVPTSAGGAISNMAVLTLGKTIVNLNYSSGTQSLKRAIKIANINHIITSKQFITKLKAKGFDLDKALEGVNIIILEELKAKMSKLSQLGTLFMAKLLPTAVLSMLFIKKVKPTDTASILFSSGSEGTPKGIELSHINIIGNIKQIATVLNPTEQDVMLGTLPIFHSFGLTVSTLFPLIEGVPVVCHPDPTDGYGIAKLSVKYNATLLFATATFYRLYARNRKIHPLMFNSLRMVIAGAEKLPKEIAELFKSRFGKTILEGYGTTETTPVASCNIHDAIDLDDFHIQIGNKTGTIGLALPGSSFIIVDPDTLKPLPIGEDGMMLIGGTQVMKGYLGDEEKTKSVIKEIDGIRWYITGDKGHIDEDGFVTIVDRYSRFAKIGGEMISLGLVEQDIGKLLNEYSQIAITAIADSKKGEKIVLLLEGDKDLEELKQQIKELKLNPLYIPSSYYKVDKIPKLGTGKADFKGAKRLAMKLDN